MPGLVGAALHLGDQRAPFRPRTAVVLPVGARIFAPVVEELHVLAFERLDFGLDERVELRELVGDFPGQLEVHGASPSRLFCFMRQ